MYVGLLQRQLMAIFVKYGLIPYFDTEIRITEDTARRAAELLQLLKNPQKPIYRDYTVFFCHSCGIWGCQFIDFQDCNSCLFNATCQVKKGESNAKIIYEDCETCKRIFDQ